MSALTLGQLQQLRVKLQRGEQLSIEEQRNLVDYSIRERLLSDGNINALVTAREAYDKLVKLRGDDDTRLSAKFLGLLVDIGVPLGIGQDPT